VWTPDWRTINVNEYCVFGFQTARGCSIAPPIYQLRPVLKEFAAASTDAELRQFVDVMRAGGDAQQSSAVEAAAARGLQALSAKN
jgi:hypothetical protein